MLGMLQSLNLELVGRFHCGIDDARNVARILMTLITGGLILNQSMIYEQGRREHEVQVNLLDNEQERTMNYIKSRKQA